jgi:hypothetical protein
LTVTREQEFEEIAERLEILTLDEDFNFDLLVSVLREVKQDIDTFEASIGASEPWAVDWTRLEHYKGTLLYVGAISNYRKQEAAKLKYPFEPSIRAGIIDRFNSWSAEAAHRVRTYAIPGGTGEIVTPWLEPSREFKATPLSNVV